MKKFILVLSFALGSTAMAATNKICYGSTKSDDTKGVILSAVIDAGTVTLKTLSNDEFYEGSFPSYNSKVKGRDGKVYLEYKGGNLEYQDVIMVDEALLKNGTTGLLQIRARGEGFFNSVFVCKDAK